MMLWKSKKKCYKETVYVRYVAQYFSKIDWLTDLDWKFGNTTQNHCNCGNHRSCNSYDLLVQLKLGLPTPGEEIASTARPKIHSHSQVFRYDQSISCLPHRPKFSNFFDLCLHWVSIVCELKDRVILELYNSVIWPQRMQMCLQAPSAMPIQHCCKMIGSQTA